MARRCHRGYIGVKLDEESGSVGGRTWGNVISSIVAGRLIRRSPRHTLGGFDGLRRHLQDQRKKTVKLQRILF